MKKLIITAILLALFTPTSSLLASYICPEQTQLFPSDGQEGDSFGSSVSMDGDYCVIGARP